MGKMFFVYTRHSHIEKIVDHRLLNDQSRHITEYQDDIVWTSKNGLRTIVEFKQSGLLSYEAAIRLEADVAQHIYRTSSVLLEATTRTLVARSELNATEAPAPLPPSTLAFLIAMLADTDAADAVLGDLDEQFGYLVRRFGEKHARIWYIGALMRSALALLPRFVMHVTGLANLVKKLSGS